MDRGPGDRAEEARMGREWEARTDRAWVDRMDREWEARMGREWGDRTDRAEEDRAWAEVPGDRLRRPEEAAAGAA